MAFEDYGSGPAKNLDKAKELYEKNAAGKNEPNVQKPEKLKPISDKVIKTKKHGPVSSFSDVFFATTPEAARDHVVTNIFLPALKDLLFDMVSGYFSMFLFDRPWGYRGRGISSRAADASVYNQAFSRGSNISRERVAAAVNKGGAPSMSKRMEDELIFDDMGTAQEYLDNFREALAMFGRLSIADVYDMCGLSHSYTDEKYGWLNLAQAQIRRVGDGQYTIVLPRAVPLMKQ